MASSVFSVKLCFVCVFLFVLSLQSSGQKTEELCDCVPHHTCVNDTIVQDGSGIITQRLSFPESKCQDGYVYCCLRGHNRDKVESGSTTPPSVENEAAPDSDDTSKPNRSDFDPTLIGLTSTGARPEEGDATIRPHIVFAKNTEPVANSVFVPKPGCGVKRVSLNQRISFASIDESIAQFAEFPWMLAISTQEKVYKFQCGASLIHPQVAMTAAHCVDKLAPTALWIRAGEWNFKSTDEPKPHQDRRASRVELHPFYDPTRLWHHDIALIYLDSPFNITDNVDTICLPDFKTLFHGSRCTVTGWGADPANPNGHAHNILHKVEVPVVPCTECERLLRTTRLGPYFRLHVSALCAGGEPQKDSCRGDGGGPLICPTDEDNRWVQAGIVSWGVGCGTSIPAVYTDVSLQSRWIRRRLDDFQQYLNRFSFRHFSYYSYH